MITSQLNSISASMVTIRTVNVLGCFLLRELKLMREAMAPAMVRGSGPGPPLPEACALGLLTPLEELHRPQGHHGARPAGPKTVWTARAPSGQHGPRGLSLERKRRVAGQALTAVGRDREWGPTRWNRPGALGLGPGTLGSPEDGAPRRLRPRFGAPLSD